MKFVWITFLTIAGLSFSACNDDRPSDNIEEREEVTDDRDELDNRTRFESAKDRADELGIKFEETRKEYEDETGEIGDSEIEQELNEINLELVKIKGDLENHRAEDFDDIGDLIERRLDKIENKLDNIGE